LKHLHRNFDLLLGCFSVKVMHIIAECHRPLWYTVSVHHEGETN